MSLQISDAVVWQEGAETISIYHTETGDFRSLNETAAKIWMLVENDGTRESVVSKLAGEFAGTNATMAGRIRKDVEDFLQSMIELGFIAESD